MQSCGYIIAIAFILHDNTLLFYQGDLIFSSDRYIIVERESIRLSIIVYYMHALVSEPAMGCPMLTRLPQFASLSLISHTCNMFIYKHYVYISVDH